jgi:predicted Fe-S protein YdhL (DUF1289 family)
MPSLPEPLPLSPCIQLCSLDEHGWCRGCYRTLAEISAWSSLGARERLAVLDATAQRRASLAAAAGAPPTAKPPG